MEIVPRIYLLVACADLLQNVSLLQDLPKATNSSIRQTFELSTMLFPVEVMISIIIYKIAF